MKKHLWAFIALTIICLQGAANTEVLNDTIKKELRTAQEAMFNSFSNGDVEVFMNLAGDDYVTINADGTYMHKEDMADLVPQFKGSTYKIIEQEDRFYDNVAISTGQVKFYIKSILAADVYFTQIWTYRDNQWSYIGWQGTMTGTPKNYPVFMTVAAVLLLAALGLVVSRFVRRRRRA